MRASLGRQDPWGQGGFQEMSESSSVSAQRLCYAWGAMLCSLPGHTPGPHKPCEKGQACFLSLGERPPWAPQITQT